MHGFPGVQLEHFPHCGLPLPHPPGPQRGLREASSKPALFVPLCQSEAGDGLNAELIRRVIRSLRSPQEVKQPGSPPPGSGLPTCWDGEPKGWEMTAPAVPASSDTHPNLLLARQEAMPGPRRGFELQAPPAPPVRGVRPAGLPTGSWGDCSRVLPPEMKGLMGQPRNVRTQPNQICYKESSAQGKEKILPLRSPLSTGPRVGTPAPRSPAAPRPSCRRPQPPPRMRGRWTADPSPAGAPWPAPTRHRDPARSPGRSCRRAGTARGARGGRSQPGAGGWGGGYLLNASIDVQVDGLGPVAGGAGSHLAERCTWTFYCTFSTPAAAGRAGRGRRGRAAGGRGGQPTSAPPGGAAGSAPPPPPPLLFLPAPCLLSPRFTLGSPPLPL